MIEIMNMDYDMPQYPYDFKIDRSTPLGNPFIMKEEADRAEVCVRYKKYFYEKMMYDHPYLQEIKDSLIEHGKVRLFCWCAPKACHGETIREYLES
ncbi:MAG: DUF4326 domain-containing protein [Bacteroidetes bacterium]|nr:DUF4326 domain-containing protein [Bacteroidota bacterium]